LLVLLAALAMVAAACGGGGGKKEGQKPTTGGKIVVGAEQWPDCMNPINGCSSGYWQQIQVWNVLPRLIQYDAKGNSTASDLITEVPSLANGGVKEKPFTLTFHLNPKAVWNDGTPITSKDIEFTWKAIIATPDAYTKTGYDLIKSIDTSNPQTAIISFGNDVFVDWIDLFGGNAAGVLQASKFASYKDNNISKAFKTGPINFSGGPWVQQSFTTTQAVFVRNDKYWGKKSYLDQMTWVPQKDQTSEVTALLSGEIVAAFPQPGNVSIISSLKSNPNAKSVGGTGNFYEGLWINNQDPVMSDKKVREAFFYAVDREEILNGLIHLNAPNEKVLNCGPFSLPGRGPWCAKTPWDVFKYDPAKAKSILESAGWNCSKVPASPCTKSGKSLTVSYRYCNGNKRRQTTFDLIKEKVKPAGFAFNHTAQGNDCASPLFDVTLPKGGADGKGTFQIADFAQGPIATDPSPTSNFRCNAIPTAANNYGPANLYRYCNEAADKAMVAADAAIDPAKRLEKLNEVYALMFEDRAFLPIYVLPNVTIWRADKVLGPVGDANSSPYGGFFNSPEWYVPKAAA
jgi:peptide/nickel transport system substrate-binding protein